MKDIIYSLLENVSIKSSEGFQSMSYGGSNINNKSTKNIWLLILTFIIVEVLLLIFGKYIWNEILIKIIPGVQPVNSIWQLLGLSILVKLIFN
jgi:hypothetical protein